MIQKALFAFSLLLGSQLAVAQQEKFQEGVHYSRIDSAPAQSQSDKVEVTEVFSYACSHCRTFEPYMQNWKKTMPANVTLDRIPVGFGRPSWELLAHGYITAEMLGIAEQSHVAMMDALWKENRQMRSVEDLANFYSQFGVKKDAFIANFKSFAADSVWRKDQRDVKLFGIHGTPTMVVNRKYRVETGKNVPTLDMMLEVVNFLIEKESKS